MKPEQLSVGDWVCPKVKMNDDIPFPPVKIESGKMIDELHRMFKPMPLTEEILRKNGWGDESGGYEHYLSIDKEHDVEIYCDGDAITWMINLGEYDIMRLEYVHQLQHVLRLFNIEEEVKL